MARRVDRFVSRRMPFLVGTKTARTVLHATIIVLALTMYPLALVPWGVTAPAVALVAFGLALIARDGLMALIGYLGVAATAAFAIWLI